MQTNPIDFYFQGAKVPKCPRPPSTKLLCDFFKRRPQVGVVILLTIIIVNMSISIKIPAVTGLMETNVVAGS